MKLILILALSLATEVIMAEPQRQASQSDNVEKRATENKDLLSHISCRYLKKNRYLSVMPTLQKLCNKTFACNDVLSHKSCNILEASGACTKDSSLSEKYCKFTCDNCGTTEIKESSSKCEKPLGMESGAIPDSSISASSFYGRDFRPAIARLHHNNIGWSARSNAVGQWIQVDLGKVMSVSGIATQGRGQETPPNGQWVTSYILQYSGDGKAFKGYQGGKIFQGNTDTNKVVKHELVPPLVGRYIRLLPKTWHAWITLRMELYGLC